MLSRASEAYRCRKSLHSDDWVIEREIICINGLAAWFEVARCPAEADDAMGYTDGAYGTARERAEAILSALRASPISHETKALVLAAADNNHKALVEALWGAERRLRLTDDGEDWDFAEKIVAVLAAQEGKAL